MRSYVISRGCSLAACLLLTPSLFAQRNPNGVPPAVPGSYLVKYGNVADQGPVDLWIDSRGGNELAPTLIPDLYEVRLTPDDYQLFLAGQLGPAISAAEYIHPNYYLFHCSDPSDTDFHKQWPLHSTGTPIECPPNIFTPLASADIEALKAWALFPGTGKTIVGIVDSGLTPGLHEFAGTVWSNSAGYGHDVFTGSDVKFDSDLKGHGTTVAGIIGAQRGTAKTEDVVGVYPGCRIMPLRAFQVVSVNGASMSAASTADVIKALSFAQKNGATVVNNSYGAEAIGDAEALEDAIDALRIADVLFVCSAGNGTLDIDVDPFYPASFDLDNMIVVTSMTPQDELGANRNHGRKTVDLGAPGEHVYGLKGQWGGYGWISGSSYATAHVSGAAALLRDLKPSWGYASVKACLLKGARPVPSLSGKVETGGALNLKQAVMCAK